ncbi:MAG: HRDC domain-containing protein [Actinomycetales bacterium]|nr:HRDC domain-containing protein [Actinomycetales bacterium]
MSESEVSQEPVGTPVLAPRDGLPDLITDISALTQAAAKLAAGTGPVAIDAERASGFKYSGRAYLVQLRRTGCGTFLIDPIEFDNLSAIQDALTGVDWILHAASQDLVCLREIGLRPTANLFDSELAGRLLGCARVGLGPLLLAELGYSLAKEHSAADWSTRPLSTQWLNYAALDVEFLIELWQVLAEKLKAADKYELALQEFAHVRDNTNAIVRSEPWRRVSGLHSLRQPRQLEIVRQLWLMRDEIARTEDIAPGRILPDGVIIEITSAVSEHIEELNRARGSAQSSASIKSTTGSDAEQHDVDVSELAVFSGRLTRRNRKRWIAAVHNGLQTATSDLPPTRIKSTAPPPPRNWQERNPVAFARLEQVRSAISALSEQLEMPIENLITPDVVRRILWEPPETEIELETQLEDFGVRPWQCALIKPILSQALFAGPITNEPQRATER